MRVGYIYKEGYSNKYIFIFYLTSFALKRLNSFEMLKNTHEDLPPPPPPPIMFFCISK